MNRILLVGAFGETRVTGGTMACDMLRSGLEERAIPHRVIDLSWLGNAARAGSFEWLRAARTLALLGRYGTELAWADTVYIPISTSPLGFFRDAAMIWSAHLRGARVVLHLHGGGYRDFYQGQPASLKAIIRKTMACPDAIIVLGELLRDQLGDIPGASEKIKVVPYGLPITVSQNQDLIGKSLPNKGTVHLLYLSNMVASKGYLDVLTACRLLKESLPKGITIRCDFCGEFIQTAVDRSRQTDADARMEFQRLIRSWNLEETVAFHGVVRGEEKNRMLRNAHLFLLPTYYPWEGQPISIIEAMSCGTPVIATPHRGIPEQVIEGCNGFLVKPGSPEAIAKAIRKALDDRAGYEVLSRNAIRHYRKHFTRKVHLDRMVAVLQGSNGAR